MKVLLLNHTKEKCGVYQFGKRVYELAAGSKKIDYFYKDLSNREEYLSVLKEVNPDYIIYNWHWDRMPWLTENDITRNQAAKHYFIYHDGSMMKVYDKYLFFGEFDPRRVAAPPHKRHLLPRPLFSYSGEYPVNDIINIGSFGFAFNHKRFPELVQMVNKAFDKAVINIHLTSPYFGDSSGGVLDEIIRDCRKQNCKPGIQLNTSTDFLDDHALLTFLAKNDINVFAYGHLQNPGLSSALDYALSVKRPIAITNNMMFRHIVSNDILLEKNSIVAVLNKGLAPIEKYYDLWSIDTFTSSMENLFINTKTEVVKPMEEKFNEVLEVIKKTKRIINQKQNLRKRSEMTQCNTTTILSAEMTQCNAPTVLFLNHKIANCGVYQFGKRVYELLATSPNVNYVYKELNSYSEFNKLSIPKYVIYNWHRATMPWLTEDMVKNNTVSKHCFLFHEEVVRRNYDKYFFFGDYDIGNNKVRHESSLLLPRPLFNYTGGYPKNRIFTIGSFGFGFWQKGYHTLVDRINKEFDTAIINFHIPHAHFGDPSGVQKAAVIKKCRSLNVKPGIVLNITEGLLTNQEVLRFLAGNDINAFMYTENGEGISSATDYALSVRRPIIITDCQMFRHFKKDEILAEKNSIMDVYSQGVEPLEEFYRDWAPETFVDKVNEVFLNE